ncbi:MAG: cytochrome c [Myxococcota bacterium]
MSRLLLVTLMSSVGCAEPERAPAASSGLTPIPSSPQRSGDPDAGYAYLLYGDYIGSGLPIDIFVDFIGTTASNPLNREGDSAAIPYVFNRFDAPNGVDIVGGVNCFACHASTLNGEFIVGLGESFSNFTTDQSFTASAALALLNVRYGEDSPEAEAYRRIAVGTEASAPYIVTPFYGLNPAFALEQGVAAYREPETLRLTDTPVFTPPDTIPASDVPPWWNVGKKNALYYNALGQGDHARLIMQICIVGVWDADHAADIDTNFPDVLAWLEQLEPPAYPGDLDPDLATTGAAIFEQTCARCHGTYSDDPDAETYPNLLVSIDEVGTDPVLAESYIDAPGFADWLQSSWFASGASPAAFVARPGYIAPPLDGIWATAPFLHNGSVPTLDTLLDSATRPTYWQRDFGSSSYDLDRIGWPHRVVAEADAPDIYDTTLPGYTNRGHTYGDGLSADERDALIEYLKTL